MNQFQQQVVPHEGTWIEISIQKKKMFAEQVVPHEGTWIEIRAASSKRPPFCLVVPHEGTWIEINKGR